MLSEDTVTSPLSGRKAAFFRIEVVERSAQGETSLGHLVVGDLVTFGDGKGKPIRLVVRRAAIAFVSDPLETTSAAVPVELVGLVRRASGLGIVVYREHAAMQGTGFSLEAQCEDSGAVLVARSDEGPVRLEERPFF